MQQFCLPKIDFQIIGIQSFYMRKKSKTVDISIEEINLYDRVTKVETAIIDKVGKLKNHKPHCDCKHFQNPRQPCESYDPSHDYYQKFWKCFLLNELCYTRLREAQSHIRQMEEQIKEVNSLFALRDQLTEGKGTKRMRRSAQQIVKPFPCPYPRCFKSYAYEIALNLHIKLKHNGGNKSDRDRAAKMVLQARANNWPIPNIYINLPPGYIDQYARSQEMQDSRRSNQSIFEEPE